MPKTTIPAFLAGLLAPSLLVAQDWPGFRGPLRNGVATECDPPLTWSDSENLRWKADLPGPGSSSPIVVGDRVIVTCYTGFGAHLDDGGRREDLQLHVLCFGRDDGAPLWSAEFAGALQREPRAVQINEHGFSTPTPASDGESVFVYLGPAGVACLALEDGEVRWTAPAGERDADAEPATNSVVREGQTLELHWGAASSPLLHRDLVIVNCSEESHSIRAFDRADGSLRWSRGSSNLEGCAISPVVVGTDDDETLIITLGGEVWGLEPSTGALRWSVETGTRGGMSPTPVTDGETVFTFGGDGKSTALHITAPEAPPPAQADGEQPDEGTEAAADPRVVWRGENLGIPSPILHDGKLLLVRTNGMAACLDANDGQQLLEERLEGRTSSVYASPVMAADRIYVVSRKRGTFVYSADGEFELLAHNRLEDDGQCNASPALSGRDLFLRSDNALYCFGGEG